MPEQVPFDPRIAENPEPRVPCVLVLDTSGSMEGDRIRELNDGVAEFKGQILGDSLASKRVELAIVSFGGGVNVTTEFGTVDQFAPPRLEASGDTPMGSAILTAIDLLAQRKSVYKANGIAYYRPWIFLITDGAPTDRWEGAAQRVQEGERSKNFLFFSVGVEGADFTILKLLSHEREPLKLKGLRFGDLFHWLSSSLSSVSRSSMTETLKLENPTTPAGWGDIPAGG